MVRAGVNQLTEWAKDSPAVSDANAVHAYNKILDAGKGAAEGLSKAEREQVTDGLVDGGLFRGSAFLSPHISCPDCLAGSSYTIPAVTHHHFPRYILQ